MRRRRDRYIGRRSAFLDALVAHGTPEQVAARLDEHLDAGADHVCVQVVPADGDVAGAMRRWGCHAAIVSRRMPSAQVAERASIRSSTGPSWPVRAV